MYRIGDCVFTGDVFMLTIQDNIVVDDVPQPIMENSGTGK
jgi:hypothetical protein